MTDRTPQTQSTDVTYHAHPMRDVFGYETLTAFQTAWMERMVDRLEQETRP